MAGTKAGSQERRKPRPDDFVFGKMIGEGSFSCVFLARSANATVPTAGEASSPASEGNNVFHEYAIKVCEKAKIQKESKQKYVFREKDVLATIARHFTQKVPFFVVLHSTFQDANNFYFCMTYAKNGDLFKFIEKMAEKDIDCVQFYAAELVAAVEFLHFTVGVIHRDLKPENILLNEKMHILITDFGSAKFIKDKYNVNNNKNNARALGPSEESSTSDSSGAEEPGKVGKEAPSSRKSGDEYENESLPRPKRKSFVGTAQYVSPEILRSRGSTRVSDLWAIGCVIYQMITGLPPFLSDSEWLIFKKIEKLDYVFQEGFNEDAKDLIRRLLVIEPEQRIGAGDRCKYHSLRNHVFFQGVDFDTLADSTSPAIPPNIMRELYGKQEGTVDQIWAKDPDAKPGAGRLAMLMLRDAGGDSGPSRNGSLNDIDPSELEGLSILPSSGTTAIRPSASPVVCSKSRCAEKPSLSKTGKKTGSCQLVLQSQNFSESEHRALLQEQRSSNKYHRFVKNKLILKQGILDKKKGLLARRRMFLLTEGPHLYYVDPDKMVLKGEVPLSKTVKTEIRDPRIFFLHTPNRVYYLLDPASNGQEWCLAIEEVRARYFESQEEDESQARKKD